MKFTLSWLKDHIDTNKDLDTIVDTLTNIGLEIESVEDKLKDFNDFTVAEVLKAEKHPDADRLKVCTHKTRLSIQGIRCIEMQLVQMSYLGKKRMRLPRGSRKGLCEMQN